MERRKNKVEIKEISKEFAESEEAVEFVLLSERIKKKWGNAVYIGFAAAGLLLALEEDEERKKEEEDNGKLPSA